MALPLEALSVKVNPYMQGAKTAAKINGGLQVSPAMWDLMKNATPEELQTLCASIGVIDLDEKQVTLLITDKAPSFGFGR